MKICTAGQNQLPTRESIDDLFGKLKNIIPSLSGTIADDATLNSKL